MLVMASVWLGYAVMRFASSLPGVADNALKLTPEIVVDTPSLAVVDGKFGYGQTVTPQAVRIGIDWPITSLRTFGWHLL